MEYVLLTNGVRTTNLAIQIAWCCISNHHVKAIIERENHIFIQNSCLGFVLEFAPDKIQRRYVSELRPCRNIVHSLNVGRVEKARRLLMRFWLDAERIFR